MNKRHQISWIPGKHRGDHDTCDCDLLVEFPALDIPSIRQERFRGKRRTIAEMYAEVKALLISQYFMSDTGLKRMEFDRKLYLNYLREYYTPPSQVAIEPLFPVKNDVVTAQTYRVDVWKPIHVKAEQDYWNQVCPSVNHIDKDEVRGGMLTLKAMCARKLSWVDTVYGDYLGNKRVVHSKEHYGVDKALKLYSDFCVNTTSRGPEDLVIFSYVSGALTNMLRHMDVFGNFGKLRVEYEPKSLIKQTRLFTSGGIMPGGTRHVMAYGDDCRVVASGQKIHLMEAAMRKLHRILHMIKHDPNLTCEAIKCILKIKDEFRYGQYKKLDELVAMLMKSREFFIPDLPHIYMSILCNEKRMKLERNNVIRIGMTHWWGGTYFLYKYLNGDLKDFFWVDGDIEGLDKHISDWLLLLYCANVHPYYDWDNMSKEEAEFTLRLLEYWATNVCGKAVCHIGGFWRFMMGQMYSGGKETSHGDSWIMAFIFYCFCEHVKAVHPHLAAVIDAFMIEVFIAIVVYGDDHIWCAPCCLRCVMNKRTWKKFLKDFFHMNLRDENEYDSLISIPDSSGRFIKKGPKFLKRYFIENKVDPSLAPILPYKEIDESMCKLVNTEFDTVAENIPVTIGHAWDTTGTNVFAYNMVKSIYDQFMQLSPLPVSMLLRDLENSVETKPKLRRLIKKVGVPLSEFFKFPSLKRLLKRHQLNAEKANYHLDLTQIQKDIYEFDEEDFYEKDDD